MARLKAKAVFVEDDAPPDSVRASITTERRLRGAVVALMPPPLGTNDGMPARGALHAQEHELRTDHLLDDIGRRSVRGGAMIFMAQAVKILAQVGAVIVLARLLPPAAFGLVAMTVALTAIIEPIRDLGLSAATIQKTGITHTQVSALFWINVGIGTLIALGMFLGAPAVAAFYGEPELVAVTRWLAVGFFLGGFGAQHWALLRRQMRFGAIAILDSGAEILSFAVAIALALDGASYWALIVQRLIPPLLILIGCWSLCRWRPSLPRRTHGVRELFAFGASLTGTSVLGLLTRNLDQVLIGWFWGPNLLGLYERTARLVMVPINNISIPVYSVGMPALSRLSDDRERYQYAFCEMLEKLAMVTMPAATLVALTADWTTEILFGPQWGAAAPLVACFAVLAVYQPAILTLGLLYLTQDRPGDLFRATIIDTALSIMAIAAGIHFGVVAVAASLAGTGLLIRLPAALWLSTRRGPVRMLDLWRTILPSALAAVAVAITVWAARRFAVPDASPLIGYAVAIPAAALSAGVVFSVFAKSRQSLWGLLRVSRLLFKNIGQPARG
jgi:PST family polysaccharide transporter